MRAAAGIVSDPRDDDVPGHAPADGGQPRVAPAPMTAPEMHCVVETGNP